jgi:hypothetical protein
MDLKELLGEELFGQVNEKLGEHKVAIVSDGNWFPKAKFDEVNEAKKQAESALSERDKQLTDLRKSAEGNEELQATIKKLQDDNKAATEKYENDMKDLRTSTALKLAIANDTHDPDLLLNLLDKSKIELGEDGTIKSGLDEQLKDLRENKAFLFKEQPKGPQFKGVVPRDGTYGAEGPTPEQAQYQSRLDEARKTNNQVQAISIKREAAQAGIQLN